MSDRPIIFSGPSVRAILEGRKSQTRRALKPQPPTGEWDVGLLRAAKIFPTVVDRHGEEQPGTECFGATSECGEWCLRCPYGGPGDRLWVRETWLQECGGDNSCRACIVYRADSSDGKLGPGFVWKPSIFMPRWASRLTLRINDVRVQRLQEISEVDCLAEGIPPLSDSDYWTPPIPKNPNTRAIYGGAYCKLWNEINAARGFGWDANPWVWVIEFERVDQQRRAA